MPCVLLRSASGFSCRNKEISIYSLVEKKILFLEVCSIGGNKATMHLILNISMARQIFWLLWNRPIAYIVLLRNTKSCYAIPKHFVYFII